MLLLKEYRKAFHFAYFHRKRVMIALGFTGFYAYACSKGVDLENDILRMGVAGSISNMVMESVFHFADTVNIRSKVSDTHESSLRVVKNIYVKEGLYGFGKGFSAAFYGSVACGFIYFGLYKYFKTKIRDFLGPEYNMAWTFFIASFISEFFTLLVYYPFDLIKCRLQSKNYVFKYKNLPHAFRKEIRENSVFGLYRGALPFLVTYCITVSIQFTIYEYAMLYYKNKYTPEEFELKEVYCNMIASTWAGAIASAMTNCLEVVTVNKQTNPELKIMEMVRAQGLRLLTKGLLARVYYNSMQSVVFFNLVLYIGKKYNVELSD